MTKPEQVLTIEPQGELRFRGPFTGSPVTSYIKLINPTTQKVYFKIKTTAPKRYCFDPNEKNKHKFMVQTVIAQEGDNDDCVHDVWKDINEDLVMEYKLKCVFENPVSSNTSGKVSAAPTQSKNEPSTVNGKNKATGDGAKPTDKQLIEYEEKLMKAAAEVNHLRVEESNLRQECLQLKEELMRYRNMEKGGNITSGRMTSGSLERSNPQLLNMTPTLAIAAVVVLIIGYFFGKLI
ncbi:Similar to VAPA: Vesicle-associated membrane protein-associated protein A (Pongo abelii) [Cotesia congregata]|uniref:Similar to VAPA: Vesicle-associated membrane protein-associated protein A (Pongo abelii) n=1 Tax=Cotesia congregata TaxID=51543 RepID=A0A8J2HJR7_COTCN|nr:Similar to VAPA: Vesicle-associated membrane protein-associated protein A (Pongo abelii) [Cotesia congregata]